MANFVYDENKFHQAALLIGKKDRGLLVLSEHLILDRVRELSEPKFLRHSNIPGNQKFIRYGFLKYDF